MDARKGPKQLSRSTNRFSIAYDNFLDNGLALAGKTDMNEQRGQIVHSLRDVYTSSNKLLQGAKQIAADPQASNIKNQIAIAAKNLTDSINSVINLCLENNATSSAQKQCDNALRDIETIRTIVSDTFTNEPVNDLNYYDCLDQIFEQSKALAESITGLKISTDPTNLNSFIKYVKDVSHSICGLVEASVQSSYLVGVSDVGSRRGKTAILDATHFISSAKTIQDACDDLVTVPPLSQQQLIQAATLIAHTAANLCNSSRQASSKTNNSLAKRHFVQSAKQVANATANLVKCIKKLDNCPFTQELYSSLAVPLIESVEYLCQYALTPDFSNVPAVISENGVKAQEPILQSTKIILDSSCELLTASKSLISNCKDPQQWHRFSSTSKSISESIKKVATYIKEKAPAKIECDKTLSIIDRCTKLVENAIISAVRQSLEAPVRDKSLQVYQEQAINSALQIMQLIDELKTSAKFEAEKLGHVVVEISNYFEPLVINVIGCASKLQNSQQQMIFLEQTKTVLESSSQLLVASKENAGNSKNLNCHHAIDENSEGTKEVLDDLIQTLEESTAQHGYVSNMVDNLTKAIARVDETDNYTSTTNQATTTTTPSITMQHENDDSQATTKGMESSLSNSPSSFVEYQTKIVQLTKLLQKNAQEMTLCQINELGLLANQLTQKFNALTIVIRGAIQTCSNRELEYKLKIIIQELGKLCINLVHLAGQYQNKSNDKILMKEFLSQIDNVNRKSAQLLLAFEANLKGTQACIHASTSVNAIIADLDTVILFATSGTLTSEQESDIFNNHRESILTTAKALVEDTKLLVTSAANSQEQLSLAAHSAVKTISKLAETVKLGAAALNCKESDAQVLLINAVKDVSIALNELIIATKLASSRVNHEAEMENLKESAKNMVANVHSLLKTVKTVEDEAARGTRALESAIEAVNQEIKNYTIAVNSPDLEANSNLAVTSAEDLIRAAKQITLATSRAVSAGMTVRQEDIIVAANMGRKAVSDLLMVCRGAILKSENKEMNPNVVLNVGYNCAVCYKDLLETIYLVGFWRSFERFFGNFFYFLAGSR
jgi:talin